MRIDFITLFPEMVLPGLRHSILQRAEDSGLVSFGAVNPRDFAEDAHRTVDDSPFGGGPGMVMKPDVVGRALDQVWTPHTRTLIMEPWGRRFDQSMARSLASEGHLAILCGRYEGIDGRVAEKYGAEAVSLGDFILTGGELAAMTLADAVVRLLPGALGDHESLEIDSHSDGLLAAPQYTRPWDWEGLTPPEVLRSGDHAKVARWRRQESLRITRERRPDLFLAARLEETDLDLL